MELAPPASVAMDEGMDATTEGEPLERGTDEETGDVLTVTRVEGVTLVRAGQEPLAAEGVEDLLGREGRIGHLRERLCLAEPADEGIEILEVQDLEASENVGMRRDRLRRRDGHG